MNVIAWTLSFLSSGWVSALAGLLGLIGVGAIIYGLFPLPYGRIASLVGAALVAGACWTAGVAAGQSISEAAALREQLAAANVRLLQMQKQADALHLDSIAAASNAADITALEGKTHDLESRTPAGACLDDATADGLRGLWSAP
ncbi:hypothetical protein [Roseixanthobacter pseudopolyaromaticivorans]|uniref:hypothetical protein n=1 Tax=Xanthobacteraceae TaxID=335928 RepID=UPI003729B1C0